MKCAKHKMTNNQSVKYHDKVAKVYDDNFDKADDDKKCEIVLAIEWSMIEKYLPKEKSMILDAGGGTGEFSVALAKKGHAVVLTDLSKGMLEVAAKKIQNLGLNDKIKVLQQDITSMKNLQSSSFDFVIAVGDPVSYCLKEQKAIDELARVAKQGACVLITVDSYFRQLVRLLKIGKLSEVEKLEKTGNSVFPFDYSQHNFRVDELKKMFGKSGLEVVEVFGLLNIVDKISHEQRVKLLNNKETFDMLMKLEMKYASEPSIIGMASHIGIVGRKK